VLRSPIRGTVSAVNLAVGDQAGAQADAAAVAVISTRSFEVDASVGAADAAKLKKGMQAEITPTGSDATVYGTVTSIGAIATADSSGAATFPVTIDVTGRPSGLYAGSSADVVITTKKVPDVLTVATPALHTENGETWVWLVDATADGGRRKVTITTGTTYGMNTEVKSGLKEGDQVEIEFFSPTGGGTGQGNQQGPVTDFQGPPPGVVPQGSFGVGQ
jgi:multidrug efflux pump subunit AcrA (membrane-fusion protein)